MFRTAAECQVGHQECFGYFTVGQIIIQVRARVQYSNNTVRAYRSAFAAIYILSEPPAHLKVMALQPGLCKFKKQESTD